MPNPLTGDYEAVFQIAVRQINGVLATLHGNTTQDAPLKLIHSTTLRIGDPPRRKPDVEVFGNWLIEHQKAFPSRGLDDIRGKLSARAPPGAARMLSDAFEGFDQDWEIKYPPDVVRGTVKLQVSSITITVPVDSSSEVNVRARVRAHYYPDPGTTDIPAPVHGDVHATFDVLTLQFPSGKKLVIQPSSQDSKIRFITAPGTGLSAADEWRIAAEVRQVLRQGLTMTPVDLPTNFPFTVFKGLGSGSSQVIALPLQLSGASLPASGLQSLTQSFIGSSGFAFAVSKEYLITDDIHDHRHPINLGAIREAIRSRPVPLPGATYHLHFSSGPTLTFKNGGIEISGQVEAETSTFWAPNGYIKFKQLVTLVLDTSTQSAKLEQVGEPEVSVSWDLRLFGLSPSKAATIIKSEIEKALSASADPIKRVFINARSALVEGLRTLDSFAAASYTAVEITPDDCVIVRGEIGSITIGWGDDIPHIRVRRRPPVVDIAETHQGAAFTAFRSWIPGGRIDRFIWSWVEHAGPYYDIWSGTAKSFTDEHRFILPKPAGITEMSQICLRVEGTRIIAGGQEEAIAGGSTCQIPQPEFAIDVPSWWEPVTLPVWRPDLADTMILRGAIAGHISITPHAPGQETFSRNTLVYFADWRSEKPLDNLSIALTRVRKSSALMVIVILPAGTFDSSRREFESRLPSAREFGATFQFSEDDEEGWTRTFAVARTPSVYLVNARGEFVWKHEGEPDPKVLATALDQHLVPTQASRFRPLRLTVSPGDFAPDILFKDDDRRDFALHRFRGRQNVLLNFCQSWSAPCVTELSRLQRLHQAGRGAPFIVSFHGGKNSKGLNEIRKRLGLSFSLVQDSRQRIARRYGVGCWPTTIMVDADGRVEHVQFGIGHENEPLPVREQSNPDGLRA